MCLAIPGLIESISGEVESRLAKVRFGQIVKEVNLVFVPEADAGDYVLVHVGIAIARIDPTQAEKAFTYLDEIGATGKAGEESA